MSSSFEKYVNSNFFSVFDFLYVLVVVNILWALTTSTGLVVLTVFPATTSLFVIIKSAMADSDIPLIRGYLKVFLKEYWKSQLLFLILLVLAGLLAFNMWFFQYAPSSILTSVSNLLTLLLTFLYVATIVHIVPIYIYFPYLKPLKIIKYAFLLSIGFPIQTIAMILLYGVTALLAFAFTAFSTIAGFLIVMSLLSYLSLKLIDKKYKGFVKEETPPLDVWQYINTY